MKKVAAILISILILYIIYYDLKIGTLPLMKESQAVQVLANKKQQVETTKKTYIEIKIKPGDTVLSLIEKNNPTKKISITKIIRDFKRLNPSANPEKIQIGRTYKFPLY